MAESYRVLGQVAPAATTNTDLYTVGSGKSTVVSTLLVCNRGSSPATFRVAIRPSGSALANQHYNAYDTTIDANSLIPFSIGITLAATDIVTVYASNANLSFSMYGSEITA